MDNLTEYSMLILAILGLASAIAKITPSQSDNKIVDMAYRIVHALGLTKKK